MVFLHSSLNLEMAPVCTMQRQVVHTSIIRVFSGCRQSQSQVSQQASYSSSLIPSHLPACPRLPAAITEMSASGVHCLLPPTFTVETVRIKRRSQTGGEVFNENVLGDCEVSLHVQKTMPRMRGVRARR